MKVKAFSLIVILVAFIVLSILGAITLQNRNRHSGTFVLEGQAPAEWTMFENKYHGYQFAYPPESQLFFYGDEVYVTTSDSQCTVTFSDYDLGYEPDHSIRLQAVVLNGVPGTYHVEDEDATLGYSYTRAFMNFTLADGRNISLSDFGHAQLNSDAQLRGKDRERYTLWRSDHREELDSSCMEIFETFTFLDPELNEPARAVTVDFLRAINVGDTDSASVHLEKALQQKWPSAHLAALFPESAPVRIGEYVCFDVDGRTYFDVSTGRRSDERIQIFVREGGSRFSIADIREGKELGFCHKMASGKNGDGYKYIPLGEFADDED